MFYKKQLNRDWVLSHWSDATDGVVTVPKSVAQSLTNYQIMGVEFLYHCYRRKMPGAILNEEHGMNFPLQVSAFLRAVIAAKQSVFVLIVCADNFLCHWHYHLTNHADLQVIQITDKNCQNDFNVELLESSKSVAFLLGFSDLRLAQQYLVDCYDFFAVAIDDFDRIATKLIVRKFNGTFNIGLSQRSFYINPDQKLQWNMLNWSNPGCVGKLIDFYEIDNNNFENFRDSYRFWWFRLTWNYCDTFQRPTTVQNQEYNDFLMDWSKRCGLILNSVEQESKKKVSKNTGKRRKVGLLNKPTTTDDESSNNRSVVRRGRKRPRSFEISSKSSSDSSVMDVNEDKYSNIETLIKPTITMNEETQSSTIVNDSPNSSPLEERNEDEDVILSIIEGGGRSVNATPLRKLKPDHNSTSNDDDDDDDFFSSLISNTQSIQIADDKKDVEESKDLEDDDDDDIDMILKETDILLQNNVL